MELTKQIVEKTRSFLNPEAILKNVPVEPGMKIADFGCGNGHYAAAAGILVGSSGEVFALDILEEALSQTAALARLSGAHNVSTRQCNLEKFGGCNLPETSCDLVIASGILHQTENRDNVLKEAYRVLKTGGRILVVEWQKNSPFGPVVADRLDVISARQLLEKQGFRPGFDLPAGSFHYALLYTK